MSESIPSSVTGFANRRTRADSTASFTYFQDNQETDSWSDEAIDHESINQSEDEDDSMNPMGNTEDLESGPIIPQRRKSSGFSRFSIEDALLHRRESTKTDASGSLREGKTSQKIYIVTEDLTIVATGFRTSPFGFIVYLVLCLSSLGFGYMVFRWLPRWRVRLTGLPTPLHECSWLVVEARLHNLP